MHLVQVRWYSTQSVRLRSNRTRVVPGNREKKRKKEEQQFSDQKEEGEQPESAGDIDKTVLGTAIVRIRQRDGRPSKTFRAVCDSGAQMNLITLRCVEICNLEIVKAMRLVKGIGAAPVEQAIGVVRICVASAEVDGTPLWCTAWVFPRIAPDMPGDIIDASLVHRFNHLPLADPVFDQRGRVDLLLGASAWAKIVRPHIDYDDSGLVAQMTSFGWVVFGGIMHTKHNRSNATCSNVLLSSECNEEEAAMVRLEHFVRRFWECETIQEEPIQHPLDIWAEENFAQTHKRDGSGRYIVTIPIDPNAQPLGESRAIVLQRFHQLERRLQRNCELRDRYVTFMREYEQLKHMQAATGPPGERHYYIPHHAVTAKFRVVFDASCKTSSGQSLNDIQPSGPKQQDDLHVLITRFRQYRVAITADIVKMYRQVRIREDQYDLQRIFWRESPQEPLREYQLTVLTYGMASSGFNAMRALLQCAADTEAEYPLAAKAIRNNFYVDDLITGADTVEQAVELRTQLCHALGSCGCSLSKWMSNDEWMRGLLARNADSQAEVAISEDTSTAILGLVWIPHTDELQFKTRPLKSAAKLTKRGITSDVARLFDPTGLVAPVVVRAKMLLRHMWILKLGWDEIVPKEIEDEWNAFKTQLTEVTTVKIQRWIRSTATSSSQIIGFADASSHAFAAVVYVRVIDQDGNATTSIVMSKTRVAPVKPISIPRLELKAAELLSQLIGVVAHAIQGPMKPAVLFSDSMVTLFWIKKPPYLLKVFVANRVKKIQERTAAAQWKHVASESNPADIASRGTTAAELAQSELWWRGPEWLSKSEEEWPDLEGCLKSRQREDAMKESKPGPLYVALAESKEPGLIDELIDRVSDLRALLRITVHILRFVDKIKANDRMVPVKKGPIMQKEREAALMYWVKWTQATEYNREIQTLSRFEQVHQKSSIAALTPQLRDGVLRLKSRIRHSRLSNPNNAPIIIPRRSRLAKLIIQDAHIVNSHGGNQIMMIYIRNRFWIPGLRSEVKLFNRQCVQCARHRGEAASQIMGDLPEVRITPARAFKHSGVDFCGPFEVVRARVTRTKVIVKAYAAIFVCLVTRAVHIELVSDMTTEAFMEAFQRFTARRGNCTRMMSDNGSTFIGARNELNEAAKIWRAKNTHEWLADQGTEWSFIAPRSPHQGGIWEAAVKAAKRHLKTIVGRQELMFEQLATIFIRIEAILNSRPLTTVYDDPTEPYVLTPAHFLIGEALVKPIEEDLSQIPTNRLKAWKHCQQMADHFWIKWRKEYLSNLHLRSKWRRQQPNLKVGEIVLMMDMHTPPTVWPLARIAQVFPDADGIVRNVEVEAWVREHPPIDINEPSGKSRYRRSVQRLCPLPVTNDSDDFNDQLSPPSSVQFGPTIGSRNSITTKRIDNPVSGGNEAPPRRSERLRNGKCLYKD